MKTEIKFKAKSQSICKDACGTVTAGACGESFRGKVKCRYKPDCSSKKYCICSVRVFCKKTTIQKQVYEKTISFRARSMMVTSTSGHDTPKPETEDTPDYGTPDTPDPEPDTPEPGTADTPEHWMPDTPDQKTISFRARSRLVPRVTSTSEHDTPKPGTEDTPDYGTPDIPDLETETSTAPEPDRSEPGTADTPDPETGTPTTPEPDTPEPGAPTTSEPGTPDTPEQEGNKTKPKLGKRKKLFKDFRSMLSLGISTTPKPDTPEPGAPTTPEPDRTKHGKQTTPEPGTPDTSEQEDNKTKPKLGKRKSLFKAFRSMLSLGTSTTPEPDKPKHGTPTTPKHGTPDTPEQEDNKTKPKLGKRKKLFKAFRSMLSLGISTTQKPDTPVPGKPTSAEPDTPEPGTPDTVEPDEVESKEDKEIKKNDRRKSKLGKVRKTQKLF